MAKRICSEICCKTAGTTVFATAVYAVVKYALGQSFDLRDAVIFAAVFGVVFYYGQTYFSKRIEKKAGKKKK